ncbi:hypothetical protein [Aliiroseovarius sp. YM-037]|uniref:hypothetical protein n=1 Tax=Aliiroseovarius sp. YM-037 TaxID=3341728 RepID=UPI003A7FD278
MNLETFAERANLSTAQEIERIELLAFYLLRREEKSEVELTSVIEANAKLHYPRPNLSRLSKKIASSRRFIKASEKRLVKLHASTLKELDAEYPELSKKSEEIISGDLIIPSTIYASCPSYLSRLADQINASFENNIFDGCAVLMRRLFEVLIILSYRKLGIENTILTNDGTHKKLEAIVNDAKTNSTLKLSRNTKSRLEAYRNLGNFSAHRIEFNARRGDIDKIALDYRASIEELLSKAGFTD